MDIFDKIKEILGLDYISDLHQIYERSPELLSDKINDLCQEYTVEAINDLKEYLTEYQKIK